MDVPITQFRQKLFDLVNEALDGKDVWVSHKGRRLRLVPEHAPSKLSRITPLNIVAPGVRLEDGSWKGEMTREWEQKWDRRLGPRSRSTRAESAAARSATRKARRRA